MTDTNDTRDISLDTVLDKLEEWRHLPAYKLETRLDVLIGLVVDQIVEANFKEKYPDLKASELRVIPEFPLQLGKVFGVENKSTKNRSSKVDFVLFSKAEKTIFLVELKTDNKSINCEQLCSMKQVQTVGAKQLLEGVVELANATGEKHKYAHLIWKLHQLKCVELGEKLKLSHINNSNAIPKCFEEYVKNLEHCIVSKSWDSSKWKDIKIECTLIFPGDSMGKEQTKSNFTWIGQYCHWVKSIQF